MKDGHILTLLSLINLGILGFLLFHRTQIVEANGVLEGSRSFPVAQRGPDLQGADQ
jgi:hypothetical protein